VASVNSSGSATGNAIGSAYTLATITTTGTFQLVVDISAMASGDTTVLSATTKVLSGGNANSVLYQSFSGAPSGNGDQVWYSAPFFSDQQIVFSLNQTAGTARSYPWKIIAY
jgi:hypothetical protein